MGTPKTGVSEVYGQVNPGIFTPVFTQKLHNDF